MKALYHYEVSGKLVSREFGVLKKHTDGTVDLGPEGGEARVTNCKITSEPENGSCTLVAEKKEPEKKETPKAK